jgi:DNA polymerase (family 10)
MVEAAEKWGWSWYFCGDHSPSLKIASGLPVPALRAKMEQIKSLNKASKKIRVYCGTEVDILADGKIDYPDEVLNDLDCVVASVHSRFKQTEPEMTERICKALRHPHVDILGHLSGRLLGKRDSYKINVETILQTARETQTAIEINGQPERQELSDVHVKRAVELGIPLAVTTDAHSTYELDHMRLAVHIARRGWAEPKNILNHFSVNDILDWLK